MGFELQLPNMDGMWPDDLHKLAAVLHDAHLLAKAKATAMECRARGHIVQALNLEADCDRLYDRLPAACRW